MAGVTKGENGFSEGLKELLEGRPLINRVIASLGIDENSTHHEDGDQGAGHDPSQKKPTDRYGHQASPNNHHNARWNDHPHYRGAGGNGY